MVEVSWHGSDNDLVYSNLEFWWFCMTIAFAAVLAIREKGLDLHDNFYTWLSFAIVSLVTTAVFTGILTAKVIDESHYQLLPGGKSKMIRSIIGSWCWVSTGVGVVCGLAVSSREGMKRSKMKLFYGLSAGFICLGIACSIIGATVSLAGYRTTGFRGLKLQHDGGNDMCIASAIGQFGLLVCVNQYMLFELNIVGSRQRIVHWCFAGVQWVAAVVAIVFYVLFLGNFQNGMWNLTDCSSEVFKLIDDYERICIAFKLRVFSPIVLCAALIPISITGNVVLYLKMQPMSSVFAKVIGLTVITLVVVAVLLAFVGFCISFKDFGSLAAANGLV